jgi:hypothetical protein
MPIANTIGHIVGRGISTVPRGATSLDDAGLLRGCDIL